MFVQAGRSFLWSQTSAVVSRYISAALVKFQTLQTGPPMAHRHRKNLSKNIIFVEILDKTGVPLRYEQCRLQCKLVEMIKNLMKN
mgnify:CR=1 FL=1